MKEQWQSLRPDAIDIPEETINAVNYFDSSQLSILELDICYVYVMREVYGCQARSLHQCKELGQDQL